MAGHRPRVDRHRAPRPAESTRPPRYRLLTAAARIPQREPDAPWVRFERDCPACGKPVMFTQVVVDDAPEYVVAEHDCA